MLERLVTIFGWLANKNLLFDDTLEILWNRVEIVYTSERKALFSILAHALFK